MDVAGVWFWEVVSARNIVFSGKVALAGDERYLVRAAVAAAVVWLQAALAAFVCAQL